MTVTDVPRRRPATAQPRETAPAAELPPGTATWSLLVAWVIVDVTMRLWLGPVWGTLGVGILGVVGCSLFCVRQATTNAG